VVYKYNWTKIIILAGLLVLPSTASLAQAPQPAITSADQGTVVEMIVIPCTPQLRPDECGVKISVTGGTATFTTTNGQTITRSAGTAYTISGTGVISQSAQNGTMLNFASAGGSETASAGGGGGAGQTSPLPTGESGGSGGGGGGSSVGGGSSGTAVGSSGGSGTGGGGSSGGGGTVTGGGGTVTGAAAPMSGASSQ
jgi:hypothetical protein